MALDFDVLKKPSGYLKLLHTVLGAVALGIVGYYSSSDRHMIRTNAVIVPNEVFFFLLVTFAFLVTSFLLLITFVMEGSDNSLGKSSFEILYHLFGFIFYFSASVCLIVIISKTDSRTRDETTFALYVIASICGLINSVAYAANAFIGFKSRHN